MFDRIKLGALLLIGIALPIMGCGSAEVDTLQVAPTTVAMVPGATAQLTATGVYSHGTGPATTQNLTSQVSWGTSSADVATVSNTGMVTAVGAGTVTITASIKGYSGLLSASSIITVTASTTGPNGNDVTKLTITPSSQTVAAPGDTATYTAIGTTAAGASVSVTNLVWSSSSPQIATITAAGVATAVGQGATTISALYTNADNTVATGTATFTVTGGGTANSDIVTLTIVPSSQSVPAPSDQATFIAVGTTASGSTVSLTGQVTWSSSSTAIATITPQTGVATGVAAGTATITAQFQNADTTVATGTASFTVLGGTTEQWTGLTITPAGQSIAEGGTSNFIALGTSGQTGLIQNVTTNPNLVWSSSIPAVATITSGASGGVATGVSAGTATITALLTNSDQSVVSATADVTVAAGAPPENILSLTVIPSSISVNNFYLTGQFLAIATYSTAPYVKDVTNDASTTWISTEPELFPVDTNSGGTPGASAGLVTAYASGGAVIVAESTSPDQTIQTATATFSCPEVLPEPGVTNPSCYPNEPPAATLLATLTVYNEGLNTTGWLVTAPSATGTPDVIHCGPGWVPTAQQPGTGSVCTATYPMNITTPSGNPGIVLTATGGAFGGWSYNCIPSDINGNYLTGPNPWTAAGPNYCVLPFEGSYSYINASNQVITVTVDGLNQTVGAIFN
jgi:uncharacterized protein YjdB